MDRYSYIANADPDYIESLYQDYRKDPASIDAEWGKFFEGFEFSTERFGDEDVPENFQKEFKVVNLINGYRTRGHLFTKTNPVRERRKYSPTLDIENFGLEESDLDTIFQAGSQVGLGAVPLKDIIHMLKETYCQSIGVEYTYIRTPERIEWLREMMESRRNMPKFTREEKKHILRKLNQASVFENFLHTKFVGQKRFSLEGAESLIPALDSVIERGAELGVEECIFGMAHRGRLNVLANIFNKTYSDIFSEFEGKDFEDAAFEGDVKYHLGFSCDVKTEKGKSIHLSMAANPSHLEAVDPVVEGITRAKLDNRYDGDQSAIVPILIHGDASLAGQGLVYEVVQMQNLKGYSTGGTIHIVVNNQIGFTTNYLDARSSTYCTDVGKVTLSPIFHVNGDDAEAVAYVCQLAMEYRQKYHMDVFIDLLCYRKYGHNESDEPRFTQPNLYKAIAGHPNPREIYSKELANHGLVDAEVAKEMEVEFRSMLQERLKEAKEKENGKVVSYLEGEWKGLRESTDHDFNTPPKTGVPKKDLVSIAKKISDVPTDLNLFKKVQNLLNDRRKMLDDDILDWGMCELLAYGTLLKEGHNVRISGQDVERGTFSHRHAIMTVEGSEESYIPLRHLAKKQGRFEIFNSLLSEYAVLGFDYGYSLATPNGLTVWEAQFGDFANGAQIIIDQFISSGEDKWKRMSGLVMLLPHGYEGQGAEHSSARMERFLQMCAEDNMLVVNCTTPANFFHAMRRQLKKDFRKPLIVFTPKSLLRHPQCVSTLDELSSDRFNLVIDDDRDAKGIKRVLFCTGKLYYELKDHRETNKIADTAIVRVEQLYPFPYLALNKIFDKYEGAEIRWVQEEPENMGAWTHIMRHLHDVDVRFIGRSPSASPASGSHRRFEKRQAELIKNAFNTKANARSKRGTTVKK